MATAAISATYGDRSKSRVLLIVRETARVASLPDIRHRFAALGLDLVINTPDEFGALIRSELVRWSKVVLDANIKPAD
jgi:tripartite-type tricarboxylate transporter receptor subunit TctC